LAFQSFDLELKQTNTKQNKPIKNIKQKEKKTMNAPFINLT
jgi:hypothetical protein